MLFYTDKEKAPHAGMRGEMFKSGLTLLKLGPKTRWGSGRVHYTNGTGLSRQNTDAEATLTVEPFVAHRSPHPLVSFSKT